MPGDVRGGMLGAPGVTALGRSEAIKVYWAEDAEIWIFFPNQASPIISQRPRGIPKCKTIYRGGYSRLVLDLLENP